MNGALARYLPGWGLGWQIWRRHRWGLLADFAWLAVLAIVPNLLPLAWRRAEVGQNLAVAAASVFIHLLAAFTYGFEIDLSAKQSGFPSRMFTLPLATRRLVAWPVASGVCATTAAWLVIARFILRPCGVDAPLALPMAAAAAAMLAVQAVSWTPFEFGWARVIVALLLLLAILAPLMGPLAGVSEPLIVGLYLACLPCLYLAAVAGVSRARRGDALQWRWFQTAARFAAGLLPERRWPFASAAQAQLWFECRRHVGLLPFFVCLIGIPFAILFFAFGKHGDGPREFRILAIFLAMPPFLAAIVSGGLGKHDFTSKNFAMPAFLATRPMASAQFVAAKFKMAAVSTLIAWLVTLALPAVWLLAPGRAALARSTFAELSAALPPGQLAGAALLAFVFLPFMTWKKLVDGMYVGLTGRSWFGNLMGLLFGGLVVAAIPLGLALQFYPEYRPLAWRLVPWAILAALAAKAITAAFVIRALWLSRLVALARLRNYLVLWCAVTAALAAAFIAVVPAGALSIWMAAASAALLVPLNRLAVAPLALNWDRHR